MDPFSQQGLPQTWSREQKRRCCQVQLEDCHAPYFEYNPPLRSSEPEGEEAATEDVNLGEPLELEPEVTYFLQGSAESLGGREHEGTLPEPPIGELQRWVIWKA